MTKNHIENPIKITKKEVLEISKGDKKLLELIKVASEVVIREDARLLKELAKY